MKNSIRVGDKVMGIMGVSGGYAGTVIAIKRDGRHNVVFYKDDDGAVYETLDSNITKNVPEKGKFPRKNPLSRASSASSENMVLDIVADLDFKPSETAIQLAISYVNGLVSKRDGLFRIVSDPDRMRKVRSKVIEILASQGETNPKGVYMTYSAWRAAAKKAGAVRIEGDKDIAQAFDAKGRGVAEWDGAEGYIYKSAVRENPIKPRKGESTRDFVSRCMSEEKMSFPEPKQRIAVCLSKSRKRNPLESGANISDDEDINFRASNMG